jgi:5-hydroxyisourate hydrolase
MTLSTHVLDTSRGRPAKGIAVMLSAEGLEGSGGWTELARGTTDGDGRIASLLPAGAPAAPGTTLRLRFELAGYFADQGVAAFYPHVDVVFTPRDTGHHHIPLLISPFGYSTYRGS